jgi:hypothetical protein
VVQFDTEMFQEVHRVAVGQDPHLGLFRQNAFLTWLPKTAIG